MSIIRTLKGAVTGWRAKLSKPEPQGVELIDGGPNAPHMASRPRDYRKGDIEPSGGWVAQLKLDGIRCLYVDGRLVTLQGQPMNCALHCLTALRDLESVYDEPMFFDGEYVEEEGFEATLASYRKGEGQGTLWLFDAIPLSEWKTNTGSERFDSRHAKLMEAYDSIQDQNRGWLGVMGTLPCPDHGTVAEMMQDAKLRHYEGLVMKRKVSLYQRTRNSDWLRLKETFTEDFKLIDIEGTDKAGAKRLVLRGLKGPIILTKGFAKERHMIWTNRELFLGSEDCPGIMVEIKHNGWTRNKQPRHAVFSKLRQDKLPPLEAAK